MSGNWYVGGLVGDEHNATCENSFWDVDTSGQTVSDGGTGKTTSEMKDVATFTDITTVGLDSPWDFVGNPNNDTGSDDYWDIDETRMNGGYPYLSWQEEETAPSVPDNVSITIDDGYVEISWDGVIGAITYKVYSDSNPYGTFHTVEWEGTDTSWSELADTKKFYYVTAAN
ncbi:MAG: hypothetical protein H8E57_04860 [Candidatus Cloacimonetes bacterium]|nr:hypothetical protein [Candidatus Cloacimonadota bacterium]